MRLSEHLDAAADGFDDQAAAARKQGDPETAACSDRLAAHMRRLAGNHQLGRMWSADPSDDPEQVTEPGQ